MSRKLEEGRKDCKGVRWYSKGFVVAREIIVADKILKSKGLVRIEDVLKIINSKEAYCFCTENCTHIDKESIEEKIKALGEEKNG